VKPDHCPSKKYRLSVTENEVVRKILGLRRRTYEIAENSIIITFIICSPHQMLFG
jgi:hypothetical protein